MTTLIIVLCCIGALLLTLVGIGSKINKEAAYPRKCEYHPQHGCPFVDEEYGTIYVSCDSCSHRFKYVAKFDPKLVELGVKQQFDKNLDTYFDKEGVEMMSFCLGEMERVETFSEFMKSVFLWHETPEGAEFWLNISKQ